MRLRRGDDQNVGVLLATPTRWIPDFTLQLAEGRSNRLVLATRPEGGLRGLCDEGEGVVLVLDGGPQEGVVMAASAPCRLPFGGEDDLLEQAAARVAALRHERLRQAKRERLPDHLIAFFLELNAADTEAAVYHALAEHALRMVGAHTALALVRDPARGVLRAPARPGADPRDYRPALLWEDRYARPGLLLAVERAATGRAPRRRRSSATRPPRWWRTCPWPTRGCWCSPSAATTASSSPRTGTCCARWRCRPRWRCAASA